eukprot:m.248695 g.248695  ORF g.248695 m.248695 type:complete len:476 (+) comp54490_c0_seq1:58-1485(+)
MSEDKSWLAFFVRPNKSAAVHFTAAPSVPPLCISTDDESRRYAEELAPALLKQILCDLGRKPSLQLPTPTTKRGRRQPVCSQTHRLIHSHLITSCQEIISSRTGAPHAVLQVAVHTQQGNPSCGYYALHNGMTCAEAALSPDPHAVFPHLASLSSGVAFWQRYWMIHRQLIAECDRRGKATYPWSRKSVESRTMERDYAKFLVENWEVLTRMGDGVEFFSLPECHSAFTGRASLLVVQELEQQIQRLRDHDNVCTVFMLGLVNHWVSLFVNKVSGKFEFILMDSLNKRILDATDEELWAIVQAWFLKRVASGSTPHEFEQLLYFQQMQDIRDSVDFIVNAVTTSSDLVLSWADRGIENILDSFQDSVLRPFSAAHPEDSLRAIIATGYPPDLLATWLSTGPHPRLIEETIHERCQFVTFRMLSIQNQERLRDWTKLLEITVRSEQYAAAVSKDAPFLQRFKSTVSWLSRIIKSRG